MAEEEGGEAEAVGDGDSKICWFGHSTPKFIALPESGMPNIARRLGKKFHVESILSRERHYRGGLHFYPLQKRG